MKTKVEIITPLQSYKFVDSFYDLSDESHFWFIWRMTAFLEQIKDLKIPLDMDWNVLDVGCGAGVLRQQVEKATKWQVDATDLDYQALQRAEDGRGQIMYYDIMEKRQEFKEKYDAILLFDVLEHIENTKPFIESLLFHLKPDGYLFVNVPALQFLYSKYDESQGHYRRYHKADLSKEFDEFPIETKDVRFWGMTNVPVLLLRKQLMKIFSKNKSKEEIMRDGFKPPNNIINKIFGGLMNIETALTKKPLVGSSVLWIGKKGNK